jgi:hypothetical protein
MRDDLRRRATFGMTIENTTTRLWFCCRSMVLVSEAFNFIDVRVFKKLVSNPHEWVPNMLDWDTIRSLKS